MSSQLPATWDQRFCRQVLNRLRDGLPPPAQALGFLSVGTEPYLKRALLGMQLATEGEYDSTILVGSYGIGKSHLLRRVQVLAEANGLATRYLELGSGGVYFNKPEEIARRLAGNVYQHRLPQGRGYYTDRKFIDQLNYIACAEASNGKTGLVVLLDELENSFDWSNLPQLRSRIKAYRYIDTLFYGHSESSVHRRRLKNLYVMIAVTPGVLKRAMREEPGYYYRDSEWRANPATEWQKRGLPDQLEITPLDLDQAITLLTRIRALHSRAFSWNASQYVDEQKLLKIALDWTRKGPGRDERQLVKGVVELLEILEQIR